LDVKAEFVCSAARYDQLPSPHGDEFCVLGRSNVGKSSFINHVFGDYGLARVSKKPGKTTLANYFKLSDGSVWVDLPGYGFARAAKSEQNRWGVLIEDYCAKRPNLTGGIWLLDVRHPGLDIDRMARQWFSARRLPLLPILMKCDKLTSAALRRHVALFVKEFGLTETPAVYSITTVEYREAFWKRFEQWRGSISK
jgi:GTP-binding protein